jgi:hypothetical protein
MQSLKHVFGVVNCRIKQIETIENLNFVNLVLNVLDALIKLFTLKETENILLITFV